MCGLLHRAQRQEGPPGGFAWGSIRGCQILLPPDSHILCGEAREGVGQTALPSPPSEVGGQEDKRSGRCSVPCHQRSCFAAHPQMPLGDGYPQVGLQVKYLGTSQKAEVIIFQKPKVWKGHGHTGSPWLSWSALRSAEAWTSAIFSVKCRVEQWAGAAGGGTYFTFFP